LTATAVLGVLGALTALKATPTIFTWARSDARRSRMNIQEWREGRNARKEIPNGCEGLKPIRRRHGYEG
jgi:hypothetical protein